MFLPIGDDIGKRNLPVTGIVLILVNVLVYIYTTRLWFDSVEQASTGTARHAEVYLEVTKTPWWHFIQNWGLVPADLAKGKWVGLLTHMFLHGDFFHVLGNMLVLWAFVGTLENALGPGKFLGCYLLWGLIAGATHAGMSWGAKVPMIGASGAVAGMMGAYFVVFGALARIRTLIWFGAPMKVNIPAGAYALIWVLLQLSGLEQESRGEGAHVAYYAHVGGFAAGAVSLLVVREQILSRLVLNSAGTLEFKDEPVPAGAREAGSAEEADRSASSPLPSAPVHCAHCGARLTEAHKIADNLFRCPGENCKRLVYQQQALAVR